ncbi:hypothetical protein Syun_003959 [Stephania yunnanensis]|uniref:Uncharacterized protein n=1 Tax=Stephania yunnanensis TaxID=152371 RepID=A0AAP0Q0B2_9MAGN
MGYVPNRCPRSKSMPGLTPYVDFHGICHCKEFTSTVGRGGHGDLRQRIHDEILLIQHPQRVVGGGAGDRGDPVVIANRRRGIDEEDESANRRIGEEGLGFVPVLSANRRRRRMRCDDEEDELAKRKKKKSKTAVAELFFIFFLGEIGEEEEEAWKRKKRRGPFCFSIRL